jgi:hypothetical protein
MKKELEVRDETNAVYMLNNPCTKRRKSATKSNKTINKNESSKTIIVGQ